MTKSLFHALPPEFREWLIELSDYLGEVGYHVEETYPKTAEGLRHYGREIDSWLEFLGRGGMTKKMPCFCGTKDAYRCPTHINPVQSTSGGR